MYMCIYSVYIEMCIYSKYIEMWTYVYVYIHL